MTKKFTDTESDKILDNLIVSTRSPRGRFSATESYKLLEKRLPQRKSSRFVLRAMISAAAFALLCLMGWMGYYYMLPVKIQTVSTLAERKIIRLPDGSEVTLNHFSSLSYPERFRGTERKVTLTGEGYFDVSKNPEHPFIVMTDAIKIQVLGTHFNVEAYRNDPEVRTSLLEGSVAVSSLNGAEQVILKPDESAIYNKVKKSLDLERRNNVAEVVSWCNGTLIFNNLPLQVIARRLSNTFGTTIAISDESLQNYHLTARFVHGEDLDEILRLLQQGRTFTYHRTGKGIIITPKTLK